MDLGERLADRGAAVPGAEKGPGVTVVLRPEKSFQRIEGFGGAFTEAAAYTFYRMKPELRKEILGRYFDPEKGIGYTMGRVHINSCDFALENYDYVREGDAALESFDVSREDRWVVPFVKAAEAARGGSIRLLASPWSPPAWMKTNGNMNFGGKLLPECRDAWARYFTEYVKAMRARGLDIRAVTVQNEPAAVQTWDSCIYEAWEEGAFVRDHLGPALARAGLSDVRIYVWDHNRDIIVERAMGALADPEAAKYVYGIADHWYVSEDFGNLSKVHELFPDKHLLFSEGCVEGGVQPDSRAPGERYARNMIGEFNNWQEGWLDWNLLLDETGGPNHVENFCDAPVIADTKAQALHFHSSFYYIGHFSRYVKPGAARIETAAGEETPLQFVGFVNEDGAAVLIALNETGKEIRFNAELNGQYVPHALPAHSIMTLVWSR
jgi:glucosylceramidase